MERKTAIILGFLLLLALLLGGNFIRLNGVYANPRGGYTTAEVSSAVIVVNGGNILKAEYDELVVRANEPTVMISILGSGFERTFNITVKNVNPHAVLIEGARTGSLVNGTNYVRFTSTVPPRLVKDIIVTPTGDAENFTFAVLGDSRDNPQVFQRILNMIEESDPLFMVHLGDMVSEGTKKEYDELTRLMNTTTVPIYTVLGNHDIKGRGIQYYSQTFGMYYYSFDVGLTHFILLDNSKGYLGHEQLDWLRNDLKNTNASLVIIFMHMPPFDPRPGEKHAMTDSQEAETLTSLFDEFQVDAVFTAHIHSYLEETRKGVHYVITGGGGAPLVQEEAEHHYILVNISNGNITAEMIAV